MLDKNRVKAVKLPKDGKHIIAVIYCHVRTTDHDTNEVKEDNEYIFLADGDREYDKYAFSFNDNGCTEVERIPLSGYLKDEYIDTDVYEFDDKVKTEWEYYVLDYVILNTQVLSKNGETISRDVDIEEDSI